jgi:hypothetical protein
LNFLSSQIPISSYSFSFEILTPNTIPPFLPLLRGKPFFLAKKPSHLSLMKGEVPSSFLVKNIKTLWWTPGGSQSIAKIQLIAWGEVEMHSCYC